MWDFQHAPSLEPAGPGKRYLLITTGKKLSSGSDTMLRSYHVEKQVTRFYSNHAKSRANHFHASGTMVAAILDVAHPSPYLHRVGYAYNSWVMYVDKIPIPTSYCNSLGSWQLSLSYVHREANKCADFLSIWDHVAAAIHSLHEGVKAEEIYEKTGEFPDPNSTDNAEFKIVLSIIRVSILNSRMRVAKAWIA
ncbi:hypothetical protein RIF29_38879 [Crotalaria pallida]|uniref:Uncharacterized protein n=1 Tax=Crotalaria pallida TaxID=3830 RepID=A0AAN9E1Y6_CROPI